MVSYGFKRLQIECSGSRKKIQAEGSRGIPYAYVHLGKGYEEATGDMGTAGGTGAITGINYKNFYPC